MKVGYQKQNIKKCFLCGGELQYLLDGYDFLYKTTERKFEVYKCTKCKMEQIIPLPKIDEVRSFYPDSYYSYNTRAEINNSKKGFFTKIREKIIDLSYNKKSSKNIYYLLALISKPFFSGLPLKIMGNNNFLDIGCGDSYNLDLMTKYSWNCYGFEIGEKNKIKNIYYDYSLADVDFNNLKFDYIRIWHVLEHVIDPMQFMKKVSSLLLDKGEIVIGIPNTKSLYAILFGKYWYNRDIPRHIFNYNKNNLEILLNKYNLKITNIKYISAGGFLGSLQNFINIKLNLTLNLINKIFLIILVYPLDMICNFLKIGDCISLTVKYHKKNNSNKKTEQFFDEYNFQEKTKFNLNDLDKFLMKNYYYSTSNFLLENIKKRSLDENTKILDIGCGAGNYLIFLNHIFKKGKYYGVDISKSAIERAKINIKRQKFYSTTDPYLLNFKYNVNPDNFKLYKINGIKLPFEDNYFDIIYFVMILHHTENYREIIEEAYRVLKKNGRLIIIDLKGQNKISHFLIKLFIKETPNFIIKKIFKNDLLLTDNKFPLRSNISYTKVYKILKELNLTIIKKEKHYSIIVRSFLVLLKLIYNKFIFYIFKPLLYTLIFIGKLSKINTEAYIFVCHKKDH